MLHIFNMGLKLSILTHVHSTIFSLRVNISLDRYTSLERKLYVDYVSFIYVMHLRPYSNVKGTTIIHHTITFPSNESFINIIGCLYDQL